MNVPLHRTYGVCPVCKARVPAEYVRRDSEIYFESRCPQHGAVSTLFWHGKRDFNKWRSNGAPRTLPETSGCPHACGLCGEHQSKTCCTLIEVTGRCNLNCRFCFADASSGCEPALDRLLLDIRDIASRGDTLLQLSGGEPTMRDDLPALISGAREAGIRTIQLNTNGLRLAEEPGYAKRLAEAGLDIVFLQFDGVDDVVYRVLRGRPLLSVKQRAIETSGAAGLGVVLVPTLVPGVNDRQIGAILRFGVSRSPYVRGVHYQPVAFMGRVPAYPCADGHLTLDALIDAIVRQSGGLVGEEDLAPSACDHPLCGLHGDFVVRPDGTLHPLHSGSSCCCKKKDAAANRRFVVKRWKRTPLDSRPAHIDAPGNLETLDGFLSNVREHGFTVTAMAFQDAYNLDLERLRRCSLHVYAGGRMIPFCAYYQGLWK